MTILEKSLNRFCLISISNSYKYCLVTNLNSRGRKAVSCLGPSKQQSGLGEQKAILQTHQKKFEQIWIIHLREVIMKSCVCRPLWVELCQNM